MDAVAGKMVLVVVCLSVAIVIGGFIFYESRDARIESLPFAVGVTMAMGVNIAKIYLLKRAVGRSVEMEATAGKLHLQSTYFMRLLLTAGVFLVAGLLHGTFVNLIGTGIGILTLPVATYSVHFFIRNHHPDVSLDSASAGGASPTQDAIEKLNAIAPDTKDATGTEVESTKTEQTNIE